jgi:hypothetical protein
MAFTSVRNITGKTPLTYISNFVCGRNFTEFLATFPLRWDKTGFLCRPKSQPLDGRTRFPAQTPQGKSYLRPPQTRPIIWPFPTELKEI